jgi:hypothetical protein
MYFAWDGYLASSEPVLWLGGPVVDKPQVGIRGARTRQYPVAKAGMQRIGLMRVVIAAVVDENLEGLGEVRLDSDLSQGSRNTYVAANIDLICGLRVSPDHAIRCKLCSHARGLKCEEDCAVWRRRSEVGPCDGRGVAHYLRAFDEVFEGFRRLEAG